MDAIDKTLIEDLRRMLGDDDVLSQSFVAFKDQLTSESQKLSDAVETKNLPELSHLLRKIRVESRQFGAVMLADKCSDLERTLESAHTFDDNSYKKAKEIMAWMVAVEMFVDDVFVTGHRTV